MRLFTLAPQSTPPFLAKFARRLIPILEIHDIHELYPSGESAELFRHSIERNTSIAIFCSKRTLSKYARPLIDAWAREPSMEKISFFTISIPESSEAGTKTGKLSLSAEIEQLTLT